MRQKLAAANPAEVKVGTTNPLSSSSRPGPIDEATANAIVRGLSAAGAGHPVWFSVFDRDDDSDGFYRTLRALFVRAGWVVRREDPSLSRSGRASSCSPPTSNRPPT